MILKHTQKSGRRRSVFAVDAIVVTRPTVGRHAWLWWSSPSVCLSVCLFIWLFVRRI